MGNLTQTTQGKQETAKFQKKFNWKAPLLGGIILLSANLISVNVADANANKHIFKHNKQANIETVSNKGHKKIKWTKAVKSTIIKPTEKTIDSELHLGDVARTKYGKEITVKKIFNSNPWINGISEECVVDECGYSHVKSSLTKIKTKEQVEKSMKVQMENEMKEKKSIKGRICSFIDNMPLVIKLTIELLGFGCIVSSVILIAGQLLILGIRTCAFLVGLPFFLIRKLFVPSASLGELWGGCSKILEIDWGSNSGARTGGRYVRESLAEGQREREGIERDNRVERDYDRKMKDYGFRGD